MGPSSSRNCEGPAVKWGTWRGSCHGDTEKDTMNEGSGPTMCPRDEAATVRCGRTTTQGWEQKVEQAQQARPMSCSAWVNAWELMMEASGPGHPKVSDPSQC